MNARPLWTLAAGLAATTLLLTSCTANGSNEADGPVTLDFWGYVPATDTVVDEWNAAHPDIQINYSNIPSSGDLYKKARAAAQSGDAPCLATIEYATLANFVADGSVEDITAEVDDRSAFEDWVWNQASFDDKIFGIPNDVGPMVMYYRTDLFDKYAITPPTTWEEFEATAAAVHAQDPSVALTNFGPDQSTIFSSYASQAGGEWFSLDGDGWNVTIDDSATMEVANFWQGMIDAGEVSTVKRWDPGFYTQLSSGKILTVIDAAWNASLISANLEDESGKWAVAPMPTWGDSAQTANSGGGGLSVMKGCEHISEAVEFATWFSTSEEAMNTLAASTGGGIYPAATAAQNYPVVLAEDPFFGGTVPGTVYADSAKNVAPDWSWTPTWSETATATTDLQSDVANGNLTLPDMVSKLQAVTVDSLQSAGITVHD